MRNKHHWNILFLMLLCWPATGLAQNRLNGQHLHKKTVPFKATSAPAPTQANRQAGDDLPTSTILEEDFALWTKGTNDQPDATIMGGQAVAYAIDASLTKTPGWKGNGVSQAGGACALKAYDDPNYGQSYGYIQTPEMEMYGEVTLTLRARRNDAASAIGNLRIALCDNDQGPLDDREFELTQEWKEIEFKSDKASFGPRNIFQLSAENCEVLIDDVKITRTRNKIATPTIASTENLSATSFKATWTPVADAKSYLVNVYRKELPANPIPKTVLEEGFDGINIQSDGTSIDTSNPNYPEGWSIDVSTHGSQDVYTTQGNYNSGKLALNFDEVGDSVLSPVTAAPITKIQFWVKPSTMEQETDWNYTMLQVAVKSKEYGWTSIANLPNYWMKKDGGYYSFDSEVIGDDVTQVKLELIQKNAVSFAVDDIQLTYESLPEPVNQLETEQTDTTFVYDKIDPQYEYYYYVRAKDGNLLSQKTADQWVDGINGVKPEAEAATGVKKDAFTANWKIIHNAGYYKVNTYQLFTAPTDTTGVVVVHEDFSGVNKGTLEEPETPYDFTYSLAYNQQTATDWMMQLPQMSEGMAGAQTANMWAGIAGLVASPRLSLDCDGGAFDVDVTAYNTFPGDTLFVMVLNNLNDKVASDHQWFAMKKDGAGFTTATVHFDAPQQGEPRKDILIAFMSMYGQPFYIDEVTIRQNVKQGETMTRPYRTFFPETNSLQLTDLPEGYDYAYDVTAYRKKNFVDYVSLTSDRVVAKTNTGTGIANAAANSATAKATQGKITIERAGKGSIGVYDAQGRCLYSTNNSNGTVNIDVPAGLYIVKAGGHTQKLLVP